MKAESEELQVSAEWGSYWWNETPQIKILRGGGGGGGGVEKNEWGFGKPEELTAFYRMNTWPWGEKCKQLPLVSAIR